LSLLTGYVSAQFHLKHDDFFETVMDVNAMPQSKWQELANFTPEEVALVTINLWPYALRYINEVYNATPTLKTG
jgi:hypothetical protein